MWEGNIYQKPLNYSALTKGQFLSRTFPPSPSSLREISKEKKIKLTEEIIAINFKKEDEKIPKNPFESWFSQMYDRLPLSYKDFSSP